MSLKHRFSRVVADPKLTLIPIPVLVSELHYLETLGSTGRESLLTQFTEFVTFFLRLNVLFYKFSFSKFVFWQLMCF